MTWRQLKLWLRARIATHRIRPARPGREEQAAIEAPLVVRLEGTNVEVGKKILSESGLAIIPADNLADAARKIVAQVKGEA